MNQIEEEPIDFMKCYHDGCLISFWFKDFTFHRVMSRYVMGAITLNDGHLSLESVISIPNHEHLVGEDFEIVIFKKTISSQIAHSPSSSGQS